MENEFFTTPETGSENPAPVEAPAETKKPNLKKLLTIGGIAVAVVAVVILLISLLGGNSYKTPLDNMMDAANAKSFKAAEKAEIAEYNGLFKKELNKIREIEKKSENYEDELDDAEDDIREAVEEYKEEYGSNYKFYYEINDKDEIKKSELTKSKKSLKAFAEQQEKYYEELKKNDERLEQMAKAQGLKKGQVEDIIDLKIDIFKKLQKVEISAGYELDINIFVKGKELDEPEDLNDGEVTIKVYKIDGKWVRWSSYYDTFTEEEKPEIDIDFE